MNTASKRGHRSASTAVLFVSGSALAAATWIGGDHGFAVALVIFYVLASLVVWFWSGGIGDVAAIMRVGGDERQKDLDLRATAYAGSAAIFFSLGGAVVQTARGAEAVPFVLVCSVAGAAYIVALEVLRRRS